jgi:hypothetical protein
MASAVTRTVRSRARTGVLELGLAGRLGLRESALILEVGRCLRAQSGDDDRRGGRVQQPRPKMSGQAAARDRLRHPRTKLR